MATASVLGKRSASDFPIDTPYKARRITRSSKSKVIEESPVVDSENTPLSEIAHIDLQDMKQIDSTPKSPQKHSRNFPANRVPLSPSQGNISCQPIIYSTTSTFAKKTVPKTPRHRDSPTTKPTTPRHKVTLVGKPLTPRSQPGTPRTPKNSVPSVFSEAKLIFARSTAPGKLVGREKERAQLKSFLDTRIKATRGGCLYISGPPGTGKSALLSEVVADATATAINVKKATINCMALKDAKSVYLKLAEDLLSETELESMNGLEDLENIFLSKSSNDVYMVILDEIDHLLTKDQEILYSVFEWSLAKTSKLILVGIANALDLTDRFLPRLKARNLKPQVLPFMPYSAEQIDFVIKSRLQSLLPEDCPDKKFVPYIHPAAISLCSKKVASQSGDLRKAFDICRRALELCDNELKQKARMDYEKEQEHASGTISPATNRLAHFSLKKPLAENENFNPLATTSPHKARTATIPGPLDAPRVTIAHIARVSSSAFGGSAVQRVKLLNLQQKAILASLSVLEKKSPGKSPTIRALNEFYNAQCRKDQLLLRLSSTEFRDIIASLEAASVVNLSTVGNVGTPSKKGKMVDERRISAAVGMLELMSTVGELPIVARIFKEV